MPQPFAPDFQPLATTRPAPRQQSLPLEPSAAELAEQVRRMWLASAYWRQRFDSVEALLACPRRRHLLISCARQAWKARMRQPHRRPRRPGT